jgi:hypothetical protein
MPVAICRSLVAMTTINLLCEECSITLESAEGRYILADHVNPKLNTRCTGVGKRGSLVSDGANAVRPLSQQYIGETEKNLNARPVMSVIRKPWWRRLFRW